MHSIATGWIWLGFSLFLIIALSIDLYFLDKKKTISVSFYVALYWSLWWIACAIIFNGLLWWYLYWHAGSHLANQKALAFFTGYLIEKSLSVDNLFVFYMIFHQFNIPLALQQRVFSYGIWSAIAMRLILILLGTWLINRFHWFLYIMGAFLLLTGVKMLLVREKEKDLSDNSIIKIIRYFFRTTHQLQQDHFFVKKNRLLYATPLFITLIFIEISDLIFALDSIPAIFAITKDPFIIWTSNVFAILGLRALYFVLAGMIQRFYLLKYGIAFILAFVGAKMLIEPWISISVLFSLAIIASILILCSVLSLLNEHKRSERK